MWRGYWRRAWNIGGGPGGYAQPEGMRGWWAAAIGSHADTHGDVAHTDAAHGDVAHGDVAHVDHSDGKTHGDAAHTDSHTDSAHGDVAHSDDHTDGPNTPTRMR